MKGRSDEICGNLEKLIKNPEVSGTKLVNLPVVKKREKTVNNF